MGDFSRDPGARLQDSVAKHYVGVRLQQGVPILDADWNELEDLRRHEAARLEWWLVGDGVPTGSDAFRVAALRGGGVGTLVLTAATGSAQPSSVEVELGASTAADALGFGPDNFRAERWGSSPARLTGTRAPPFPLADGASLVVRTDGGAPESVVFDAGDFADIAAATAAEVVAAVSASVGRSTASAGTGNDFIVRGGRGADPRGGALLVEGRLALNERDLKYTEQPLFQNDALAAAWGVAPVPALAAPGANTLFVVFLDVWDRLVDVGEDPVLVDPRIGVETALRLRREWAVRVAEALAFPGLPRPPGHAFYPLAELARTSAPAISAAAITDRRETDISVRREVAYRNDDGTVLVDTAAFRNALVNLRDTGRGFIDFLTARFVDPGAPYLAGEVAGIDALSAVAGLADHGVTLIDARVLGTGGALGFLGQVAAAETRFVAVWRDAVLPLVKPEGTVYEQSYGTMLDVVESFLAGPAPAGFTALNQALQQRNLSEAMRAQEQITNELGEEVGRPTGVLSLTYLGSPAPTIQRNVPFNLEFAVAGSVTPDDDLDVQIFAGAGWQTTLRNADGTVPMALRLGPGPDTGAFLLTVRPPDLAAAETQLSLRIQARRNSGALYHVTAQRLLRIGDPPPPSEEDFAITFTASVAVVAGVFQVPVSSPAMVNFRLFNNTNQALTADLEFEPAAPPLWTVQQGSFALQDQVIPANGDVVFSFQLTAPGAPDNDLVFRFRARDSATSSVVAETQITLTSV